MKRRMMFVVGEVEVSEGGTGWAAHGKTVDLLDEMKTKLEERVVECEKEYVEEDTDVNGVVACVCGGAWDYWCKFE